MRSRANARIEITYLEEPTIEYVTKLVKCLVDALHGHEDASFISYNPSKKHVLIKITNLDSRTYPWVGEFTRELMTHVHENIGNIKNSEYHLLASKEFRWEMYE